MPTLSPPSAQFPPRLASRPTRIHLKGTLVVAIIIVGLATASCGQYPTADAATPISQQECVSAVYTVLTGMIAKPNDDQPFDDFVTHYGTASPTYAAYRDSFDPFYNEAVAHGIKAAEQTVRGTVTKDCSTAN
ncbi:MAG TPA: hypothetical protein VGM75_10130 [Pseudonocardiaceae bacterium]|jgi:hypothetical protein